MTIEMLEEPASCRGSKEDKIKYTFGATEGTNETNLLVTYFDNTRYLVNTAVTNPVSGLELSIHKSNLHFGFGTSSRERFGRDFGELSRAAHRRGPQSNDFEFRI